MPFTCFLISICFDDEENFKPVTEKKVSLAALAKPISSNETFGKLKSVPFEFCPVGKSIYRTGFSEYLEL